MPVTNTSRLPPERFLFEALTYGSSGSIERMERNGTMELAESRDSLPADMKGSARQRMIDQGFEIGEPYEDDPLFVKVKFPAGWRLVTTDHDMWVRMVDPEGVVWFEMFYKAAYYDRKAFLRSPYTESDD